MDIKTLSSNVRFYVLISSILLSALIYFLVKDTSQVIQSYALLAVTYLYFTLLATPLTRAFTFLPFRGQYVKARRALGVSAFYFGLLHATLAFFGPFGGFASIGFLGGKYLLAFILGLTTLVILTLMAGTAFDFMIDKLGFKNWKILHRFVYLAAVSVLIHALIFGSHFQDLSGLVPKVMFIAVGVLLILEGLRFSKFLQGKFSQNN